MYSICSLAELPSYKPPTPRPGQRPHARCGRQCRATHAHTPTLRREPVCTRTLRHTASHARPVPHGRCPTPSTPISHDMYALALSAGGEILATSPLKSPRVARGSKGDDGSRQVRCAVFKREPPLSSSGLRTRQGRARVQALSRATHLHLSCRLCPELGRAKEPPQERADRHTQRERPRTL